MQIPSCLRPRAGRCCWLQGASEGRCVLVSNGFDTNCTWLPFHLQVRNNCDAAALLAHVVS